MIPEKGPLARLWGLEPNTVFLNHGSFGASPIAVRKEQDRIRNEMEEDPVYFVERKMKNLWEESIFELSRFLNADPEGMVFVTNATMGVNTVLRSLKLSPGEMKLLFRIMHIRLVRMRLISSLEDLERGQ